MGPFQHRIFYDWLWKILCKSWKACFKKVSPPKKKGTPGQQTSWGRMVCHQLCRQLPRAHFFHQSGVKTGFPPDFCHQAPIWPESLSKAKPFISVIEDILWYLYCWHEKLKPSFILCHFRHSNWHSRSRPCAHTKLCTCSLQGSCIFWSKTFADRSLYLLSITAGFYTWF